VRASYEATAKVAYSLLDQRKYNWCALSLREQYGGDFGSMGGDDEPLFSISDAVLRVRLISGSEALVTAHARRRLRAGAWLSGEEEGDLRVLTVLRNDGNWYLASPGDALFALAYPGAPRSKQSIDALREQRQSAREKAARRLRSFNAAAAGYLKNRRSLRDSPLHCGRMATVLRDPAGDVKQLQWNAVGPDAARPASLLAADIVRVDQAVGGARVCLKIVFSKRPPSRYDIVLSANRLSAYVHANVYIRDAHVALDTATEPDAGQPIDKAPIAGLTASASGRTLWLRLPIALKTRTSAFSLWGVESRSNYPFSYQGVMEDIVE
jgi:hypothetical protein